MIAKRLDNNTSFWLLEVANAEHNHKPTLIVTYPVHSKITLNKRSKIDISHTLTVQSTFLQILSSFCLLDPITEIDNNYKNIQPVNFLFKKQNIHNVKAQIRWNTLKLLIFIQVLLHELDQEN